MKINVICTVHQFGILSFENVLWSHFMYDWQQTFCHNPHITPSVFMEEGAWVGWESCPLPNLCYVYTGEWLGCDRCEWVRAENLDWSQRSHPLVPVIRGLHLHERPIEMLIAMERPIGLRLITTDRIGRTRLKRVSMESWLVQRPVCVWKWARPSWDGVATTRYRLATEM